MTTDLPQDAQDRFHAHLDLCQQCSNEAFNLCPTGERLLKAAVREITDPWGAKR